MPGTRLPIRAWVALRAMEDTTGIRNVARCECLVEENPDRADAERDDADEFSDEFSAFVDARSRRAVPRTRPVEPSSRDARG